MNLDFLQNVKLEAVPKTAKRTAKTSAPKLPTDADIRLFANGRVYPSEAFAKKHNLEFGPRESVEVDGKDPILVPVGNGLDIFSSKDWAMLGELPQAVIFCAIVPKKLPKVDMWGSTKYEDDGSPKASVLTQGANTFAKKRFTAMVADAYGVNWEATEYVDLKFIEDQPMVANNGIYIVPKIVSTGARKGQPDYIRRENITVCPLVVVETKSDPVPANAEPAAQVQEEAAAPSTPTVDAGENSQAAQVQEEAAAPSTPTVDAGENSQADWAEQLGQQAN